VGGGAGCVCGVTGNKASCLLFIYWWCGIKGGAVDGGGNVGIDIAFTIWCGLLWRWLAASKLIGWLDIAAAKNSGEFDQLEAPIKSFVKIFIFDNKVGETGLA